MRPHADNDTIDEVAVIICKSSEERGCHMKCAV